MGTARKLNGIGTRQDNLFNIDHGKALAAQGKRDGVSGLSAPQIFVVTSASVMTGFEREGGARISTPP
jgi:hypothetical protein